MLGIIEEKSKKGGIIIMGKLTCAITGYRPSRFRFKYNENNKDCKRIKRRMEEQFSLLYQKGVHHFIVGGALGVDMWAGEILLAMKEKSEFSEIKLTMALPFEGYDVDWDRVSRERKNQIQKQAEVLVIGKEPGTPSYTKRNHFMVDHADIVLAVYDNDRKIRSGTALTVRYAERKERPVILIHPDNGKVSCIGSSNTFLEN